MNFELPLAFELALEFVCIPPVWVVTLRARRIRRLSGMFPELVTWLEERVVVVHYKRQKV